MQGIKKSIITAGAALALTLSGGAAIATTAYPAEGGQWNYGLAAGVHAYSDYLHPTQCHGSSVYNDWGSSRSIDTAGGYWSGAALNATPFTHNSYYYRTC